MSHSSDESEDVVLSRNHSGLTLNDDGSSGGNVSGGVALKKGPWTSAEDAILVDYVKKHGEGNWNAVQKHSGLFRCGKSCRLRWANHLRPNLKKGAFTAEEERLIIELHAKMGNKWARMAAHLPGRTDNEIKNYWNTRIKRRQRAGLPLYPPEVCMQAMQECQSQNTGGTTSGDKRHHGLLPINSLEIPDVIFDSLKGNQGVLSYVPEFPDISPSSLLIKGLSAPQYCGFMPPTMHRLKRFRESVDLLSGYDGNVRNELPHYQIQDDPGDKIDCSFGSSCPYDPDPATKNLLPFGAFEGSHALLNGDFSASKPTFGAVKSELPSLQYLETDIGSWGGTSLPPPLLDSVDAFIQSPPPAGTVKSECLSPRNSGLLDALLYEAKTLSSAKNHSSDKSSNSSTVTPCDLADSSTLNICQNEWEDYGESVSPLGHSATSIFSDCAPIIGSGTSLDGHTPDQTNPGCKVKTEPVDRVWTPDGEKEISTRWDVSRPDVLLGSDWLEQSAGHGKEQVVMTDAIAALLGNDSGSDYKNTGLGTSALSQAWGLGCAWNNMPAVCQMSELP